METSEMKIKVPEMQNKRWECKIDPTCFKGKWLKHQPTTREQEKLLALYQDAKAKDRLHSFTCKTIDPSIKYGKIAYQKGLPVITTLPEKQWKEMLKEYEPSRNSRQMTRTEYACRNLFLIQRLVEFGYEIDKAWSAVCDNSAGIGNYINSDNATPDFEPTGSREVCGFCDLGNCCKFIAEDPWNEQEGILLASGRYYDIGYMNPVAYVEYKFEWELWTCPTSGVGLIALD